MGQHPSRADLPCGVELSPAWLRSAHSSMARWSWRVKPALSCGCCSNELERWP